MMEVAVVKIYKMNELQKAKEYYEKSLVLREQIKDNRGIANSLFNIGNIHYKKNEISLALECFQRSLIIRKELDDKKGIA